MDGEGCFLGIKQIGEEVPQCLRTLDTLIDNIKRVSLKMNETRLHKLLQFIDNEPNDPFLKYALATEYLSAKDYDSALKYFEDLVNNHESYVGTYYHLGKLYEFLGRKEDAIASYRKGMQVARGAGDNHAYSELQTVYNSAIGLDYEDD